MANVKLVAVGDGSVGKTCLLVSYTTNAFPTTYVPTVFDNFNAHLMLNQKEVVNLGLWDTAGQDDYDRLRPLSYPQTDVFLAVFSVISPTSFRNIKQKWIPELRHYAKDTPIILVGAKSDMRADPNIQSHLTMLGDHVVSFSEGEQLAKEMGCVRYTEVSALTQDNLHYLFSTAAADGLAAQKKPKKKSTKCVIM